MGSSSAFRDSEFGERASDIFSFASPQKPRNVNDASQIEQPKEEGGRGRWQGSQEDQAAGERRQERQTKEGRDEGEEGCRQGKKIWLVKVCGDMVSLHQHHVDNFYIKW